MDNYYAIVSGRFNSVPPVKEGHLAVVTVLVNGVADLTLQDKAGETAFAMALQYEMHKHISLKEAIQGDYL